MWLSSNKKLCLNFLSLVNDLKINKSTNHQDGSFKCFIRGLACRRAQPKRKSLRWCDSCCPPDSLRVLNRSYKLNSPTPAMVMQPFWNEAQLHRYFEICVEGTPPACHHKTAAWGFIILYSAIYSWYVMWQYLCGGNVKQERLQVSLESASAWNRRGHQVEARQVGSRFHNHSFIYQARQMSWVGGPVGETVREGGGWRGETAVLKKHKTTLFSVKIMKLSVSES